MKDIKITFLVLNCVILEENAIASKEIVPAGWGVVAVLGNSETDEDGLGSKETFKTLCGPVVLDPSDEHFLGATIGLLMNKLQRLLNFEICMG